MISKTLSDLPSQVIYTLAHFIPAYTLTGQIAIAWRAAGLFTIIFLGQLIGESIGMVGVANRIKFN